jgi:hypothetical protein
MTDIGLARKQRVFAVMETTAGTLVFPAAANFIRPAGNAVMNQSPAFVDSEELQDTLDILDQFQQAMPAGDFTVPTLLRPSTTVGGAPQAEALWKTLMGGINASTGGSASASASTTDTSIPIDGISGGTMPEKGVVTIGSEKILYEGITRTARTATTATITSCTRAIDGTTAAAISDNDSVSLTSRFYKMSTQSSTCSVWVETDHFIQGLSGCTINQAVIGVTNDGPVTVEFSGQGMQMVWAGKDNPTHDHSSGGTTINVSDAKRFAVGAFIYNETAGDANSNGGYEITRVDSSSASNNIGIGTATSSDWNAAHTIRGFLPAASVLGTPIEGRYTGVEINDVAATIKTTDLTVGCPKAYLTDEVGQTYPSDFVDDVRDISASLSLYFRKQDAKYFTEGYAGNEVPVLLTFDDADGEHRVDVYMKRCKLTVPSVAFTAPTVELSIPMKALGTVGEDSCEVVFN